ncbi:MAG TPA: PP2C family protein-serine/threonine phosphatase [Candidatus Binatia bacterium]|nr:PP2C family protein-serine/threonine phosphatase [Candidatus Binatia bacterium]
MRERTPYWKTVPALSRTIGVIGVFFLFSIVGFAIDIMFLGRQKVLGLVLCVFFNGLFAISYAIAGTVLRKQRWKVMVLIFVAQNVVMNLLYTLLPPPRLATRMEAADIARMHGRLNFSADAIIVAMVLGYCCFLYVSITEGRRYFRAHAEIELATEIHRTLVPTVDTRVADFEFYGRSLPSGEVGGDLIDVFQDERGWIAYVADVSGHGVAPGVVMGMVKSAARMRLSSPERNAGLLESLNSVLCSVTRPEMFVTFAYLASNGGRLEYSMAGHHAILHYHAATGEFSEVACRNLPLGLFDGQPFASSSVEWASDDLFLLLTDGLLEVEDAKGEEFGLGRVKAVVAEHATAPMGAIFQALLGAVHRHGRATDDQSLLLVRSRVRPASASA